MTSPSAILATSAATPSPMQSGAITTGLPSSSDMRTAHGARLNLSSGPSLGRPRCEERSTLAPLSIRYLIVGTDARMRVSSVIVLPSSGTLRSQRTSTRLPLSSASVRSPTDFFTICTSAPRALDAATRDADDRRDVGMRYAAAEAARSARQNTRMAMIASTLPKDAEQLKPH